ncbi:MAG TPA: universal stress protein [Flavobacteriaceae bacterium]|nr:universal stress protein [Flavobacteriaceae bacterium]
MENILVPVDFSTYSESALKAAAQIAATKASQIYVLHVIEVGEPIMGTGAVSVDDANILFFSKLARKKLTEFLDKSYLQGITVTNIIELGPTYHSITKNIEKFDIDMIVMGSKGSTGMEGFFIGSNTEKVVRNSSVPVLVIKNMKMDLQFNSMVFVSDFEDENPSAFQKARDFANGFGAELKLMAVNTKKDHPEEVDKLRTEIGEFLRETKVAYNVEDIVVYADKNVEEGILNGAKSIGADLIAMGTHGRKGLARLFNGSIAEDVVNHSNIPVITFKIEE